jgi:tripartite ATP-independent transporter DctP family solute receptor
MKRRAWLQGALAAMATAALPSRVRAGTVLTATDVHPSNYPTVEAVRFIGERLAQETGGELSLRLYHSGQLGRESDAVDMARFGAIDVTRVYSGALNNAFPLTRALCLPATFDSVSHLRRTLDGEPGQAVLRDFARRDLVGLAIYDCGPRCFYNTQRPIVTPADLRGLKLRVPPSDIFMTMLRDFGANPTPLPYGEVFSALETRLIDGAENNIRSFHASRHFEGARYWSQSAHSWAPDVLLISRRRFDALTPTQRELLLELARQSVGVMRQRWDEGEAAARAAIEQGGVAINAVDASAFAQAVAPLMQDQLRDPDLAGLHRAIRELA